MQDYKYTYQDWVNGELENSVVFFHENLISKDDYQKILIEQSTAYSAFLDRRLQFLKKAFRYDYDRVFVKRDFIKQELNKLKDWLDSAKGVYSSELAQTKVYFSDGRQRLTKKDVKLYLSSNESFEELIQELYNPFDIHIDESNFQTFYILRHNFYYWLLWFKEQEINKEPSISFSISDTDEVILLDAARRVKEQVSYTWLGNPGTELSELYQRLIDKKLIHPNTKLEQLKAVFEGKPLQAIEPINWIGAKNLLAYFLDCIQKHKIPTNTNVWSIAGKCFIDADNLAQSRTNYENSKRGTPKQSDIIDEILKAL